VLAETPPDEGGPDAADPASVPKGIPQFWLGALRAHDVLGQQITEKDEEVLAHLVDVRCEEFGGGSKEAGGGEGGADGGAADGDDEGNGFRIVFEFEPNDYFDSTLLTMTYHMDPDDDGMLERVEGTRIPWKAGKDVTVKRLKRKPKPGRGGGGGGGRAAAAAPQYKIEPVESFFHWFAPPDVPGSDDDDDASEGEVEALQAALEESFEVAEAIRDEVVPNAVAFYTGEAVAVTDDEEEEGESDDDDDDDDSHSDDDDDDDDDDDSDDSDGGGGKGGKRKGGGGPPTDAAGDKPAECKQQ
jgi:nucleosome assembly protein 1-like 1